MKKTIETIHERNTIINNIFEAMAQRSNFLVMGHRNPDEDCIASIVAFSILLSKFSKNTTIYLSDQVHEHFQYLINICIYNSIRYINDSSEIVDDMDTIVVCDTPKPSMIDADSKLQSLLENPDILTIEIDHHLGADSRYIGDDGYCLVTEASSASELVGLMALKLQNRRDLLDDFNISNPLSRNIILSVLTGVIGDTNMGQFIKSRREKRYYDIFSNLYNTLLIKETTKETNFTDMKQVFREIQRLSTEEEQCFQFFNDRKDFTRSVGYVVINDKEMAYLNDTFDCDTIVSVARTIADTLAEDSGTLGMVVYDDTSCGSNLVQFRLRRSKSFKSFDVRRVLDIFSIANGGGHEGAIGFRIDAGTVENLNGYVKNLIDGIEKAISE